MTEQSVVERVTPEKDARNWAMICHLSALAGFMIPFGNIVGPLIVWAVKKDEHDFVDEQGKEMLNFQLTMTIAYVISAILMVVLIGFVFLAILCVYALIMIVIAAIKANDGVAYRFPYTIRFLK